VQCTYSFIGKHLDAKNCCICGQNNDYGWEYEIRNWKYWYSPSTFIHFSIICVHQFVWFVVKRKAATPIAKYEILSRPWFVCSFIANVVLNHIAPFHVIHECSLNSWLHLHNVTNTTYFKQVAKFELWQDFKKNVSFLQWHSIETFCSRCLPYPKVVTFHYRCKAWIKNMMTMFGWRWSQPLSKMLLVWTLEMFTTWVICFVCKLTMIASYVWVIVTRLFKMENQPTLQSLEFCWINFNYPEHWSDGMCISNKHYFHIHMEGVQMG
jgi:hypothetical protein